MKDLVLLAVSVAFFALSFVYARSFDWPLTGAISP